MIGTFTIARDGRVICRQENLITTQGKKVIQRYLAGQLNIMVASIAIGTGSTAALVSDQCLEFEFDRADIDLVAPDFVNGKLIFRSTFSQQSSGLIKEVGTFSIVDSSSPYSSKLLIVFDSVSESWTGGVFAVDGNRIGGDLYRLSPATGATATATLTDIGIDLSGYSNSDKISLAYYVTNAFTSSVKLRLKVDNSNYFEYVITSPSTGYKIANFYKNNFALVGNPTWDSITSVDVLVVSTGGGGAIVDFDGLRVDDSDLSNPDYALVSRAILGIPIQKVNTSPLEIEYSLDVSV